MNKLSKTIVGYKQELMDMFDLVDTRLKNRALASPALAIGAASKTKVKIVTANFAYLFNGEFKDSGAAQEVAFTATTHDIVANATKTQERYYFICLDGSGTATIVAGEQADGGSGKLPEIPTGKVVIGYVKIVIAAGATNFDATTDELDEAHITDTYVNLGSVGSRFDAEQ